MIVVDAGCRLTDHDDLDTTFRAWLSGQEMLGASNTELRSFFRPTGEQIECAPIWQNPAWLSAWQEAQIADLPEGADQERYLRNVDFLATGQADVVITGQQPGFMGGPLYTLYKIASTIVLAEMRSAAGRRTIPVYWSGDDDDDIRESYRPYLYDPRRCTMLRGVRPAGYAERMVGALPARQVAVPELAWLQEQAHRNTLVDDLIDVWKHSITGNDFPATGWGRLQRRVMKRIFRDSDLVTVSGNDSNLHEAAEGFYQEIWQRRGRIQELADAQGQKLVAAGFHAQIGPSALKRIVHLGKDGRRHALATERMDNLPPAASIRPGVAIRSLMQDWLFRPAGVVVGPGELAYLKQLEPVYSEFGVARSPLLPRLFGQLLPAGVNPAEIRAMKPQTALADDLQEYAQTIMAGSTQKLVEVLRDKCDVTTTRSEAIAAQQQERWQKATVNLLHQEYARSQARQRVEHPVWVRPGGLRQERTLASWNAVALWGDELIGALLHACRRHFDYGLDDDWREFQMTVPDA